MTEAFLFFLVFILCIYGNTQFPAVRVMLFTAAVMIDVIIVQG